MTTTRLPLGQSLAIDLHHCERARIADADVVKEVMIKAAKQSGATVVDSHFHQFAPQGISGVVIITESHFAIHTWPEHGFAAVDLFTCGSSVNLQRAVSLIKEGFGASNATVTLHLERGPIESAPTDQQTLSISVHGCRAQPQPAAQRFLAAVHDLAKSKATAQFVPGGFALLDENLSVSGRMVGGRVDISVMCPSSLAPPQLASMAMAAFEGSSFRFRTGH